MKLIYTDYYLLLVEEEVLKNLHEMLNVGEYYYQPNIETVLQLCPKEKAYEPSGNKIVAYRKLYEDAATLNFPLLPDYRKNIYKDLRSIGLTFDQCIEVEDYIKNNFDFKSQSSKPVSFIASEVLGYWESTLSNQKMYVTFDKPQLDIVNGILQGIYVY